MKLYRNLIILAAVVAVLAAGYFLLSKYSKTDGDSDKSGNENIKITDYSSDDIVKITITNEDGVFVAEKKDDKWTVTSPAGFESNEEKLKDIADELAGITAEEIVNENATQEDLGQYGLHKPVELAFELKNGEKKTILIGNETPVKNGYYAMLKGEPSVYLIDNYSAGKLRVTENDLIDNTLFDLAHLDIKTLAMYVKGKVLFKAYRVDEANWNLTEPIEAAAKFESISTITTAIANTKTYTELIEKDAKDLEQYGLANPLYVFEIGTADKTYKLMLGKEKVKDSQIYAMLEGSNKVFTLGSYRFNFVDMPLKEFVDTFVYMPSGMDQVERIIAEIDGRTINCELDIYKDEEGKSDTEKDRFKVNGKDVTGLKDRGGNQLIRSFYKAVTGVLIDEVEPDAEPGGKPEITVTYFLKSEPGSVKIEYIPKGDGYYYIMKNGKYSGLLVSGTKSEMGLADISESAKDLMDAYDAM